MAVPPAPDGEAVGDPSDSTDTTSSDHKAEAAPEPRGPMWLLVALFVVVVGCLVASTVALGRAGWSADDLVNEQRDPQAQREQVMAVASDLVTRRDTYTPKDLDADNKMPAYVNRVKELMTAKAFTCFEQGIPVTEAAVAQGHYASTSDVYAVGVASMESDKARVLVAGSISLYQPHPERPREPLLLDQRAASLEVALVRTGDEWLVDGVGPAGAVDVTGCEQAEQPTPSETPSQEPSPTGPQNRDGGDGQ